MQWQHTLQDFCSFGSQVLTSGWRCMPLFVLWVPSVLPFRTYLFLYLYLLKGFAILIHSLEMSVSLGLKILVPCDCSEQRRSALGEAVLVMFPYDLWKQSTPFYYSVVKRGDHQTGWRKKTQKLGIGGFEFSSTFLLSSRDIYYSFKVIQILPNLLSSANLCAQSILFSLCKLRHL